MVEAKSGEMETEKKGIRENYMRFYYEGDMPNPCEEKFYFDVSWKIGLMRGIVCFHERFKEKLYSRLITLSSKTISSVRYEFPDKIRIYLEGVDGMLKQIPEINVENIRSGLLEKLSKSKRECVRKMEIIIGDSDDR